MLRGVKPRANPYRRWRGSKQSAAPCSRALGCAGLSTPRQTVEAPILRGDWGWQRGKKVTETVEVEERKKRQAEKRLKGPRGTQCGSQGGCSPSHLEVLGRPRRRPGHGKAGGGAGAILTAPCRAKGKNTQSQGTVTASILDARLCPKVGRGRQG